MNAATVSGPRWRIRSASRDSGFGIRDSDGVVNLANPKSQIQDPDSASLFSHRHKRLVVAAPDAQLREVARLHLLELALCFGCVRHAAAVDRENNVALPQRAGRWPVGIDVGDDRARLSRWKPQPPRQLRCQVLERQAKAVRALLFGLLRVRLLIAASAARRLLLGLEIQLLDGDVERFLLPITQHLDGHARARPRSHDHLHELRSEEHTSELQSQSNLVCRLLLEKKQNTAPGFPDSV